MRLSVLLGKQRKTITGAEGFAHGGLVSLESSAPELERLSFRTKMGPAVD